MNRTTKEMAWGKVAKPEDEIDGWVKKLNALSREMDEIAGSVHPSMALDITAGLREKFRGLAQKRKVVRKAA